MNKKIIENLIQKAVEASKESYNPYSKYRVGAALLTKDEKIISGTNIENSSYGLIMCAERVAIFKAVSEGYKDFKAIAVYTKDGGFPCGACLQVMAEFFKPNTEIILAKT
jgi:cytidine deaminase